MKLSERSIGWLRYLHRKAHTEDNWAEFGHPHPHWDAEARDEPERSAVTGRRADLVDSSFAMGLMAHTTPAWTEPYVAVLDQLVERHTGWWAIQDVDQSVDADVSLLVLLGIRSMIDGAIDSELQADLAERVAARIHASNDSGGASLAGLAATGLGLHLHNARHGSTLHQEAFQPVWNAALDGPTIGSVNAALLAAPFDPVGARRLFDRANPGDKLESARPLSANRIVPSALLLAKEWGMTELEHRLAAAIEASYEPTWRNGEFTWGMGLGEPHPPGQCNALLAAAEAAGAGWWERLAARPIEQCPQVVDVDVPNMAFDRAEWIDGNLHLGLAPRVEDPTKATSFRVIGAEPRIWDLHGIENARMESRLSGLNVRVPMVKADVSLIRSSY